MPLPEDKTRRLSIAVFRTPSYHYDLKRLIHISPIISPGQIVFVFSCDYCILQELTIVHQNVSGMKKVADILNRKGNRVTHVSPVASVLDALKIMADQNIGSVMVLENGEYLGIMTERDYSRKIALKGRSSIDAMVSEIMSSDFPRITPHDSIDYCMQLMSDKNIRYLPVFSEDQLCGIISINDVVKETIISQQETISQLKDYLHASM